MEWGPSLVAHQTSRFCPSRFFWLKEKKRSVCPCVRPQVAKATGGHKKNVWEIMNVPNLY